MVDCLSTTVNTASAWRTPSMNCLEKKCRKPSRLSTPMMAQALELPCLLPHIHCIFKLRIAENWQIIIGLPFGFSRNLWCQTFHSFQAQLFIFFSFLFRRIVIVNILRTPYKMWYRWIEYVKKARHGGGQYFLIRLVLPPVLSCWCLPILLVRIINWWIQAVLLSMLLPTISQVQAAVLWKSKSFWGVLAYRTWFSSW